jgi:NAD+ synthase (glutamine-hydrolysing)
MVDFARERFGREPRTLNPNVAERLTRTGRRRTVKDRSQTQGCGSLRRTVVAILTRWRRSDGEFMNRFGFLRVAACTPKVAVAAPARNVEHTLQLLDSVSDADVVVFPELGLTGYTCGDLFRQSTLLEAALDGLTNLAERTAAHPGLIFVGAPLAVGPHLYNCAVALHRGRVLGVVPKTHLPNYSEFYEARWFRPARGVLPTTISLGGQDVPFGTDLLFTANGATVFAEICEDLWVPIPPSSFATIAGANVLVNLSASNETVGKHEYRTELVRNQSGRCVAAYAYASAGPGESSTDLVFGGHSLICENGQLLASSRRVGDGQPQSMNANGWFVTADIDLQRLDAERRLLTSFDSGDTTLHPQSWRRIEWSPNVVEPSKPLRDITGQPFVPANEAKLAARCAEVFGIQCAGLRKRLEAAGFPEMVIGVSGGLDSTLALLVAVRALDESGRDRQGLLGLTLPGFGTTSKTRDNAVRLMDLLGIRQQTIDIRAACLQTFRDLGLRPFGIDLFDNEQPLTTDQFTARLSRLTPEAHAKGDLAFENVQARERTKLLMNRGFVIGTGDLSESALGWCTYNADHMSMYGVNCSIPKTLVRWLVRYVASDEARSHDPKATELAETLRAIADTTISPELLPPGADGDITQDTEALVGPYELHDFFLYHFLRGGCSPEKLLFLSDHAAFSRDYPRPLREKTLRTFLTRFFKQQYKRSCVPDGPKVGSVSLSPRGDWRMPSDAEVEAWLQG